MKVLLVAHAWPDEALGGTELHVRALARGLARRGHGVVVVVGSLERARAAVEVERRDDLEPGLRLYRIHRCDLYFDHWQKSLAPAVTAAVRGILREERPDLMHLHHWLRLSRDLVLGAAREGLPAVVSLHDSFTSCPLVFRALPGSGAPCEAPAGPHPCVACAARVPPFTPWVEAGQGYVWFAQRQAALARELDLARALIVPSASQRQALARFLGREHLPAEVIPPAHRPAPVAALGPPRARAAHEALVLACWSGGALHKGLPRLLEALAAVRAGGRAVELLLAGAAPAGELPSWVRGFGPFAPEELLAHPVTRAHAMVSASLAGESYGLVHDEALLLGLPAILPRQGAFAERGGCGVRFFDAARPGSLAAAVEALCEPDELARLTRAARAARPSVPDVDRMLERTLAVYARALDAGAPATPPPESWYEARLAGFALEQWDAQLAGRSAGELGLA